MDQELRTEVDTIASLKAQEFATVLGNRLVEQVIPAAIEAGIRAHNLDIEAHGGVQMKTARAAWAVRGFVACLLLMGGAGIERVFGIFF